MSMSFLDVAELSEQQLQRQSNALFAGLRPVQAGATAFESLAQK